MLYYNRRQTIQRTIGTEQQAAAHDRTEQLNTKNRLFTAQTYARAVLGVAILSVRLSICPSVTRVHCDKTK